VRKAALLAIPVLAAGGLVAFLALRSPAPPPPSSVPSPSTARAVVPGAAPDFRTPARPLPPVPSHVAADPAPGAGAGAPAVPPPAETAPPPTPYARAVEVFDRELKGELGMELAQQNAREEALMAALAPLDDKSFFRIVARYRSTPAVVAIDRSVEERVGALDPAGRASYEQTVVAMIGDLSHRPDELTRLANVAERTVRDPDRRRRAAERILGAADRWDDTPAKGEAYRIVAALGASPGTPR
jgi:hypothetical protein